MICSIGANQFCADKHGFRERGRPTFFVCPKINIYTLVWVALSITCIEFREKLGIFLFIAIINNSYHLDNKKVPREPYYLIFSSILSYSIDLLLEWCIRN